MNSHAELFVKRYQNEPFEYLGCVSLDGLSEDVPPKPEVIWCKPSKAESPCYSVTVKEVYIGIISETDMFLLKHRMTRIGTQTVTLYMKSGKDLLFDGYTIFDKYVNEIFRAVLVR